MAAIVKPPAASGTPQKRSKGIQSPHARPSLMLLTNPRPLKARTMPTAKPMSVRRTRMMVPIGSRRSFFTSGVAMLSPLLLLAGAGSCFLAPLGDPVDGRHKAYHAYGVVGQGPQGLAGVPGHRFVGDIRHVQVIGGDRRREDIHPSCAPGLVLPVDVELAFLVLVVPVWIGRKASFGLLNRQIPPGGVLGVPEEFQGAGRAGGLAG